MGEKNSRRTVMQTLDDENLGGDKLTPSPASTSKDSSLTDKLNTLHEEESSPSTVVRTVHEHPDELSTGVRAVISDAVHSFDHLDAVPPPDMRRSTFICFNHASSSRLRSVILWRDAMKPSDSTSLLASSMTIKPGDTVFDLGTGTGVIAINAIKLGAKSVVASDIHPSFIHEIEANLRLNLSSEDQVDIRFGDLFAPVKGEQFDQILLNPPSIPSPPDQRLDAAYASGPDGRAVIDRFLDSVHHYLKPEGRFTMVHGSLANHHLTMAKLHSAGFTSIAITEPKHFPFKQFYPREHLARLKAEGKAEYDEQNLPGGDVALFEQRYVISAVRPN